MCYTGECPYEQSSGPDAGECQKPGNVDCPCLPDKEEQRGQS